MKKLNQIIMSVAMVGLLAQTASADCLSRAQRQIDRGTKGEATAAKVYKAGNTGMSATLVMAFVSGPVCIFTFLGSAVTECGAMIGNSRAQSRIELAQQYRSVVLYAKGLSANATLYNQLKAAVQSKYPQASDDEIRNALIIGDRDETVCGGRKFLLFKVNRMPEISVLGERLAAIIKGEAVQPDTGGESN